MILKEELLSILEQNRHQVMSGQLLANQLNVSRTAIWKCITALKEDGYEINTIQNKGYQLHKSCDVLSVAGIKSHLKSCYQSNDIFLHQIIPSTNEEAKRLLTLGVKDQTVVLAEGQSAGKGRFGRAFYSPARSGIYMTLILHPNLQLKSSVLLSTAVSVAICRAIEVVCGIQTQIKWVNDIYLNEKKVGGILTEAVTDFESGRVESVMIGIGLNVSTDIFPKELEEIATSIKPKLGTRNQLVAEILNQVFKICENLESANFLEEYKERSTVLGEDIYFIQNGVKQVGKAIEIDHEGALMVKLPDSTIIRLNSGEITIRKSGIGIESFEKVGIQIDS